MTHSVFTPFRKSCKTSSQQGLSLLHILEDRDFTNSSSSSSLISDLSSLLLSNPALASPLSGDALSSTVKSSAVSAAVLAGLVNLFYALSTFDSLTIFFRPEVSFYSSGRSNFSLGNYSPGNMNSFSYAGIGALMKRDATW